MFKNDTFLCDILTSWFTIKTACIDPAEINIETEIVWNNSIFKIANKTIFLKHGLNEALNMYMTFIILKQSNGTIL